MSQIDRAIQPERLFADLDALDRIGRGDDGLFRVAWSPAYREGVDWLKGRFAAAGLTVHEDAATNVWGTWETGNGPALLLGSHIDSVPNGGKFDGAFGVLAALEVVRTLKETHAALPFPLAVVAWADEEGARFGTGFFGSAAFIGQPITDEYVALGGPEARDILTAAGADLSRIDSVALRRPTIGAYLEMHIEQGPRLEAAGMPLGVVTAIRGIERYEWTLTGSPSHSGSTPFAMRRDAGIGMARTMIAHRAIAQESAAEMVATVGRLRVTPDVPNIVPGTATFVTEFRSTDAHALAVANAELARHISIIGEEEHLTASSRPVLVKPPTPLHPAMQTTIAAACERLGVTPMAMPSGPGHDAGILAPVVPAGMIFVPSIGGISHAPEEYTDPGSLTLGANALLHSVLVLAERGLPAMEDGG